MIITRLQNPPRRGQRRATRARMRETQGRVSSGYAWDREHRERAKSRDDGFISAAARRRVGHCPGMGRLSAWCLSLFVPLPAHLALPEAAALSRGPYLSCQLLHKDSCYARVGTYSSTLPAEEGTAAASHCPPSSLPDNLAPIPVLEVAGFATGSLLCLPSFTLLIFDRHSLTHSLTPRRRPV